jgi:hypothetical protein
MLASRPANTYSLIDVGPERIVAVRGSFDGGGAVKNGRCRCGFRYGRPCGIPHENPKNRTALVAAVAVWLHRGKHMTGGY